MPMHVGVAVAARDVDGKVAALDRPDLEPLGRAAVDQAVPLAVSTIDAEAAVRRDADAAAAVSRLERGDGGAAVDEEAHRRGR